MINTNKIDITNREMLFQTVQRSFIGKAIKSPLGMLISKKVIMTLLTVYPNINLDYFPR